MAPYGPIDAAMSGRNRPGMIRRIGPILIAGARRERDGAAHQPRGGVAPDAAAGKGLEARLIGRRRRDVGAGLEIIEMHLADQLRPLEQAFGRPERISKVRAAPLQFGGERSVHDEQRPLREERADRAMH